MYLMSPIKRYLQISAATIILSASASAQQTYYSIFSYDGFVPRVTINDNAASLQQAVAPEMYHSRAASLDMRWLDAHDSLMVIFWQEKGDTILHILRELSGLEWTESEFEIFFLRYFPSIGSPDPLIIPLGGITKGSLITVVPNDNRMVLNLIFQLSGRMLAQVDRSYESSPSGLSDHPLMEPGPYRRDNLALLLALSACRNIIGIDSTQAAFGSAFWIQNMAGLHIFKQHFRNAWVLTPEHTLADQVAAEPRRSRLVSATRRPRSNRRQVPSGPRIFVEDLPLKGRLGFTVKLNLSNQLEVVKIDTYRDAYACGLREGDVIRRVNGALVRSQKQMVEKVLETFEIDGATLQLMRGGGIESIVLQSYDFPENAGEFFEDNYYEWETIGADSSDVDEDSY